MRGRIVRFAAALQALLLMATLLVPALVAATGITTDLWVYQDGDTVTVTGVDYGPNEVVDFVTTDPSGVVVDTGSASSDDSGGVVYQFVLHATTDGIYDVVATGESSGSSATTQFDPVTVSITNSGLTTYGPSASITISGTYSCSGGGGAPNCTTFVPTNVVLGIYVTNSANGSTGATPVAGLSTTLTPGSGMTATNSTSGTWTFTFAGGGASLSNGVLYDVKAVFNFTPGTSTSPQTAVKDEIITSDKVAPAAPTALSVSPASPANNNNPTVSGGNGSAEGGSTVRVYRDSSCTILASSVTAAGNGSWSVGVTVNDNSDNDFYATATDVSGNTSGCSANHAIYVEDSSIPGVTLSSAASNPTNVSPIHVSVDFTESVNNFVVGDIAVANGSKSNFSGTGSHYEFDVTPGQGLVTVNVAAGVATDNAGNGNSAATELSRTFDNVGPTVTVNQKSSAPAQADPTAGTPINFSVHFNEAVTDFDATGVTFSGAGANLATVTGSGQDYNVAISGMTSDGIVTVSLAAGVAHDGLGNSSSASTSTDNQVRFDVSGPSGASVSINNGAASTTSTSVNLHLLASDPVGVNAYRVANGSDCSGATYVAAAPSTALDINPAFTLVTGGGTKTVCAQFRDIFGHESTTVTDTIAFQAATSITEVLNPASIFFGQSTVISGYLTDASNSSALVNFSVAENQTNNPCNSVGAPIGSDLTDSSGLYEKSYRPSGVGTDHVLASFAGDTSHAAVSTCQDLTVSKAPSAVANAIATATSITTAASAFVDYEVRSAYGIAGMTANGNVSVVADAGLTCTIGTTGVAASQGNADGTVGIDAGFAFVVSSVSNTSRRVMCSSATPGTYNLHVHYSGDNQYAASDSATVTLHVTSANTAPVITVPASPVIGEATSPAGAVVTFSVTATDAEDNPDPTPSCDHNSGDTFPLGETLVSCSVTDLGGLSDSDSFTVRVVDTSDPVVSITTSESDNGAGWYNVASNDLNPGLTINVSVTDAVGATSLSCTDNGNDVGSLSPSGDSFVVLDGVHSIECTAADGASNSGSDSSGFSVDQHAPAITDNGPTPAAPDGLNGWYVHAVSNNFSASDSGSGLDAACDLAFPKDVSTGAAEDSAVHVASGTCSDLAGNTASSINSADFPIDLTAPSVTVTPARGVDFGTWYNHPVVFDTTGSDATSGVSDTNCSANVTYTAPDGTGLTVGGSCTDNAGNVGTGSSTAFNFDDTNPSVTVTPARGVDFGTWYNHPVVFDTTGSDATSGVSDTNCSANVTYTAPDGTGLTVGGSCTDNAGNVGTGSSTAFNFDDTNPTITFVSRLPAANAYTWNNSAVTVTWSCADATSGAANPSVSDTKSGEGSNQSATNSCYDNAGNTATASVNGINIDLTNPTTPVFSSASPANGGVYYFGFVPAQPTCSSTDALSGIVGCVVTGYSAVVGSHTMTATGTDKAGNTSTSSRTYTVNLWTLSGFYSPVDMGGVVNTVKAGSTVPIKFEIFAGPTELTSVSYITGFEANEVGCGIYLWLPADDIEITSTGGTQLRYDSTGGQFIQNWQTPKNKANTCWNVVMTTNDGQSLFAFFKLK